MINLADQEKGRLCFKFFHNFASQNFSAYPFQKMDDLIATVKTQKGALFVDEYLGSVAGQLDLSDADLKESMEDLAKKLGGGIPANWITWGNALADKVNDYSLYSAAKYTVVETAKDVVGGVAEIGDSAIFTLNVMKYLIPVLIIGGVGWIGYSRIRSAAGR